jgi:hypothetical protein
VSDVGACWDIHPASDVSRITYRKFYLALRKILKSTEKSLLEWSAKEEAKGHTFDDVRMYLELHVTDLKA